VIQNSSEEANREIKNSFKKMRKNREFRKHSDISNIKDIHIRKLTLQYQEQRKAEAPPPYVETSASTGLKLRGKP
jgi:hypothetical protein